MRIRHSLKIALLGLGFSLLAGCASTGENGMSGATPVDGAMGGNTQAAGLGNENGFGGEGGRNGNKMQVANQTYYFDYDRSDVHSDDKPSIQVQGRHLAEHQNAKVLLEGNTDPRGSREYNIALGERRANAVADALKLEGANKDQVRIVSYGAEKRAAQGSSEEDYQRDRRANLVYEEK